ncbi:MAG: hypothetical protein Q7T32_00825 [Moraxellaceae bacterium]|nr:hypothetical protein [Moraxellaceae bacterium]
MDKRQGALAALLGLVVVAGLAFWWMTREPEAPADITPVKAATLPMTTTVSAPLASTPAPVPAAPPSDEVALSEEVIDQIRKEGEELNSRAADLEAQVHDGEALIAMKEKQIRELEAQLKAQENTKPAKP